MEKIARTYGIPERFQDMSGLAEFVQSLHPQHIKTASVEYNPDLSAMDKIAMGTPEATWLMKFAESPDAVSVTQPNGHHWRVAQIDGVSYLVSDDEQSADNKAIMSLLGGE